MSREKERFESIERAKRCGLTEPDAMVLRRIALALHRWFELECGDGNNYGSWSIERDEETEIPYFVRHHYRHGQGQDTVTRYRVADRETGARKHLDVLMQKYPSLRAWIQTDPRGGTIYLCKPEDATDSLYTRGVFIA